MAETVRRQVGNHGESIACDHLRKKGFRILERNVQVSHNEIDIIAEDDRYIVFVEVKTRTVTDPNKSRFGSAGRAVNLKKRTDTVKAARAYLRSYRGDKQPRIDVIEVYLSPSLLSSKVTEIKHIENAFDASGRIS